MRIFEIESEIRSIESEMETWAAENEGDVSEFPFAKYLTDLHQERERKILSLACLLKEIDAEGDAAMVVAKAATARAKAIQNRADRLRQFIENNLDVGEKMKDDRASIGWRKSEAVELEVEPEQLPEPYRKSVTTVSADKTAIKEAIKGGQEVAGAKLVSRMNLQVK